TTPMLIPFNTFKVNSRPVIFFTLIKIPPLIFWLGLIIVNLPENNYKVNPKIITNSAKTYLNI
ncbi:MAG TPA: hypothetical protein DCR08_08505, partial [Lactobacillus sp.]|nr:hypothetical protein [Lactobacillus sp.]